MRPFRRADVCIRGFIGSLARSDLRGSWGCGREIWQACLSLSSMLAAETKLSERSLTPGVFPRRRAVVWLMLVIVRLHFTSRRGSFPKQTNTSALKTSLCRTRLPCHVPRARPCFIHLWMWNESGLLAFCYLPESELLFPAAPESCSGTRFHAWPLITDGGRGSGGDVQISADSCNTHLH